MFSCSYGDREDKKEDDKAKRTAVVLPPKHRPPGPATAAVASARGGAGGGPLSPSPSNPPGNHGYAPAAPDRVASSRSFASARLRAGRAASRPT